MEKLTAFWILPCVLTLTFLVCPSIQQPSMSYSGACYGTDKECDFFRLQCSEQSMIRLYQLYVIRKEAMICHAEDHCNTTLDCCTFVYQVDPWALFTQEHAYDAYRHCSGRTSCADIKAPQQVINNITGAMSSFVHLVYYCDEVYPDNSDLVLNVTCEEVIPTEFTTSSTAIKQQRTAADTTRAGIVSSDDNLSTGAIIVISLSSGVALTLIVGVVSFTVFRCLRTRESQHSVELHSPVHPTIDDTNTASSHSSVRKVDFDGPVYHTIDDTNTASSLCNLHEAQGYESLSRDGDHDNHAYHGVIPADSTVGELRDY